MQLDVRACRCTRYLEDGVAARVWISEDLLVAAHRLVTLTRGVESMGAVYGVFSLRPALGPMGGPADMPRARANLEAEANSLYQPRRHRRPRRRYHANPLTAARAL